MTFAMKGVRNMCKVSVLVPVYNAKTYLTQCLDSLSAQTLDDIEFLCIDDGSTDGSGTILEEYASRDARFRVIHKENSGYGASMNLGLRAARGEYIGILESDDFADAQMFASLYAVAEKNRVEMVRSNYYTFDEANGDVFQELLQGCRYGVICSAKTDMRILQTDTYIWTAIYQKDFLRKYDIWFRETPGAAYQDVAFCMKTLACCPHMVLLRDAYVHYRVDNADASVQRRGKKKAEQFRDEFRAYWDFLRRQDDDIRRAGAAAAPNMWRIYGNNFWENTDDEDRPIRAWELKGEFEKLERAGLLREDLWPREEWEDLNCLLHRTAEFIWKDRIKVQKKLFLREGFYRLLESDGNVYLFGAGQIAKWLIDIVERCGDTIAGILVSDPKKNPASVKAIPVCEMYSVPADPARDLVIIAVTPRKPEVQQEIFAALVQAGYRNIIVLTRTLQQALH